MASVLTAPEIATYRLPRHWKKYFLAIAQYNTIFTAELDAVPTSNDMVTQITYVNGAYASGYSALTDIRVDMTLYVGTSAGAYDLGMCRIRKTPTSSIFYIAEKSEVDWGHGGTIYLTVKDDFQLRPKHIKLNGSTALMDVDIAYSNQHATFDPVPIMGGHRIAVLDEETGLAGVVLGPDANTAAWVLNSTIASVLWEIPGAALVDDLAEINPVVVYDTPGTYPVYCTFTSTTGKTAWGVRYVIIFDHSANRPIIDFTHQNKNVTYDAGGWSFDVAINSNATQADIRDHSLCILFSENYIDGELVQRPEPFPADQSIETTGYIGKYSISRNWEKGSATFTVEGAQGWLKKMQGFPSGLEFKIGAAAAWTDMPLLTTTRMVWHYLHWRTTATKVMDVILPPDTLYSTGFNSMQKFLWDQIVEIANPALFASPGVDCYGRFFLEVEPQMVPFADRTWPTVMTFSKGDWHGEIHWDVETEAQIGILASAGLYVNSSNKPFTYFSLSPGHVPKDYGGDISVMNNVPLVNSQTMSNNNCGLYAGWKNNPYKRFEVSLRYNFKAVDLWPRQYFGLVITSTEDPRGVGFNGRVIPREITFEDDRSSGFEYPIINFEAESFQALAIKGDIPINPNTSIEFPPFANFDPDFGDVPLLIPAPMPLPDIPIGIFTHCLLHCGNHGLLYTSDFDSLSPTWVLANGGIDDEDADDIDMMLVTPSGEVFISFPNGSPCGSLRYASNPLSAYSVVFGPDNFMTVFPELGAATFEVGAIGINHGDSSIGMIVRCAEIGCKLITGGASGFSATSETPPGALLFGDGTLSYGNGEWAYTADTTGLGQSWVITFQNDGTVIISKSLTGFPNGGNHHARLGSSASVVYFHGNIGSVGYLSSTNDNFANTNLIITDPPVNKFDTDLTGQFIMGTDGASVFRSSDGGATWGDPDLCLEEDTALTLPADFPAIVSDVFCIDKDRWIVIGATTNNAITGNVIIYTDDFGETWQSKVGNLLTLYPDSASGNLALNLIQAWP